MIAGSVRRVCFAVATVMLLAVPAWAQNAGSLSGSVVDPLGAKVSGAAVKLLLDGKVVKDGSSDARGDFAFDALAEGRYSDRSQLAEGFQSRTDGSACSSAAARKYHDRGRAADRPARNRVCRSDAVATGRAAVRRSARR